MVIGHRGCAGDAPENTLLAFEHGLEQGAVVLETDVHVTRDGVAVLSHDPDVARTTNATGLVADHTFSELQRLDAGHRFERDGEHPFRGRGLCIPSLAAALAAFPDARFNLELKADRPGAVEQMLAAIADAGAAERTLVTAENGRIMQELHRRLDALSLPAARGASAPDVLAFVRAALDGVAPAAGPMALQVPARFAGGELVTPAFVTHAHAHGIQVHVWTINALEEMQRLLDLDVDGLVTDFPARLRDVVRARAA
jgi:glycerophosphoryl diester phosphodiesterase